MVTIYCRHHHVPSTLELCQDCTNLLNYAIERLDKCVFGEKKPPCLECSIHCYKPEMRKRITDVMRYSGPRMIAKHPFMAISHLLKGYRYKRKKKK